MVVLGISGIVVKALPYLTFGADDTLRRHSALKPSSGPIALPHKAKG